MLLAAITLVDISHSAGWLPWCTHILLGPRRLLVPCPGFPPANPGAGSDGMPRGGGWQQRPATEMEVLLLLSQLSLDWNWNLNYKLSCETENGQLISAADDAFGKGCFFCESFRFFSFINLNICFNQFEKKFSNSNFKPKKLKGTPWAWSAEIYSKSSSLSEQATKLLCFIWFKTADCTLTALWRRPSFDRTVLLPARTTSPTWEGGIVDSGPCSWSWSSPWVVGDGNVI